MINSNQRTQVLITGASGRIGAKLTSILKRKFEFIELQSLNSQKNAFAGLIHLAGNPDMNQSWNDVVQNGVTPALNSLEAARTLGVPKFVYASSCYVVDMNSWRHRDVIPVDAEASPQTPYGLGKAYCEALARFYAKEHGLIADVLRMGWVIDVQKNKIFYPVVFDIYCNPYDLANLVQQILEVDHTGFNTFYAVSKGTKLKWDIGNARRILNHRPRRHVSLFAGPFVVRDYLRRAPGILYRGLKASIRNRFYSKPPAPEVPARSQEMIRYDVAVPQCDHPREPAFLKALNELYTFLERNKDNCVTICLPEQGPAVQKLFSEMVQITVQYFLRKGLSIETRWKTDPP